jgi:ketosteroid isomerase-like protein
MTGPALQEAPLPEPISETERARAIVRSFYDGGARGDITSFKDRLAEDFELFVPEYLPWGGHFGKQAYVDLLPRVAAVLDFTRLTYESLTAEGNHVVAFINIGVQGTDGSIMISEHWDIVGEKANRLRVAYFDPKLLLDQIAAGAAG